MTWRKNLQSLFFRLLMGGVGVITSLSVIWFIVGSYFSAEVDKADGVRSDVHAIQARLMEIRLAEKDFLLSDLREPGFYQKGTSRYLEQHKENSAALKKELSELVHDSRGNLRQIAQRMDESFAKYQNSFGELVRVCRERGYRDFGIEGDWYRAARSLDTDIKASANADFTRQFSLIRADAEGLFYGEELYRASLNNNLQQFRNLILKQRGPQTTRLLKGLQDYESAIKRYAAALQKLGITDHDGLQGELQGAANQMDPLVSQAFRSVTLASTRAHHTYMQVRMGLLVLGLLVGTVVFYSFAKGICWPIFKLKTAAVEVGNGRLDTKLNIHSKDEIGDLAQCFEKMVGDLKASRSEILSAKSFVDNIIHSMADMLIVVDPEGGIKTVNSATLKVLGYSESELIGHSLGMVFGDKASSSPGEKTYITKDGRKIPVFFSNSVMRNEEGRIRGMVCVAKDMTERKLFEKELAEARDTALESTRLKSEFLANMSHEIRTPMNGIIGMTGLMLESNLSAEQKEFASSIRSCADSLLTIINDILDFSKIEAGRLSFETLDFDLHGALDGVIELFAERVQAKHLELACLVKRGTPTQLRGDSGRLRQVLLNLVGNAVKFTEKGEVVIQVCMESETESHVSLRFEVRDTGIGISRDGGDRLFQPFTQADSSTTRRYGGTGLGLVISKQLVERMGGTIGLESAPGEGSVFWFTVNLEKQKQPVSPQQPRLELLKARILVADDHEMTRRVFEELLGGWGLRFETAAGGGEVLERLRAAGADDPYTLLIADVALPEKDGVALARELKAEVGLARTRIILMASFNQRLDGATMQAEGIDGYLLKPVRQAKLWECLESATTPGEGGRKPTGASGGSKVRSRSIRVLVAEDNIVNQKVAVRQLEALGFAAEAVANGLEVLEALSKINYDVVLMDCQMPEMDGYEATREIRKREGSSRHTLIVAMTAHVYEGDRAKCLEAGMDEYLSKPIRPEELQNMLGKNSILERRGSSSRRSHSASPRRAEDLLIEGSPQEVQSAAVAVNLQRFKEAADGKEKLLHELVALYLKQTSEQLEKLGVALKTDSAAEVENLAHACAGSSLSCDATGMVRYMREMERLGREGQLAPVGELLVQAREEFERVKFCLQVERFAS